MTAVDHIPTEREVAGHSSTGPHLEQPYKSSDNTYPQTIVDDEFYTADAHSQVHPETLKTRQTMDVPMLPPKSALRASRMLDGLHPKSAQPSDVPALSQATLDNVYLSSEEDASSSADDFSDYDWESETDDTDTDVLSQAQPHPQRRDSHEAKARVVSVVFMGKPSIIDLPSHSRPMSSDSVPVRRRASTVSCLTPTRSTPAAPSEASPPPSVHQHIAPRKSSLASSFLSKKKPLFLGIDPYANGSSYSLDIAPTQQADEESLLLKTPRTPTLLKNMSRTLSLVRKKSRPVLRMDTSTPTEPLREDVTRSASEPLESTAAAAAESHVPSPSPTMTYNDIIKAAKKNTAIASPLSQTSLISEEPSPMTPSSHTNNMRGLLSGLKGRRKSIKLTGRVL